MYKQFTLEDLKKIELLKRAWNFLYYLFNEVVISLSIFLYNLEPTDFTSVKPPEDKDDNLSFQAKLARSMPREANGRFKSRSSMNV